MRKRLAAWHQRVFWLYSPDGFWETALVMVLAYLAFIGMGLAIILPILFVGCGRNLCGFFG